MERIREALGRPNDTSVRLAYRITGENRLSSRRTPAGATELSCVLDWDSAITRAFSTASRARTVRTVIEIFDLVRLYCQSVLVWLQAHEFLSVRIRLARPKITKSVLAKMMFLRVLMLPSMPRTGTCLTTCGASITERIVMLTRTVSIGHATTLLENFGQRRL